MLDDISQLKRSIFRKVIRYIFFFFGVSATVALMCMQRLYGIHFGGSAFIFLSTIISFFIALSIGSLLTKYFLSVFKNEIQFFMLTNAVLGFLIIFYFVISPGIGVLAKFIFQETSQNIWLQNSLYFIIIFIITFIPSALFGSSIISIFRFLIQTSSKPSREFRHLSVILTSGVFLGIILIGFLFFHTIGIKQIFLVFAIAFFLKSLIMRFLIKHFDKKIFSELVAQAQQLHLQFTPQVDNDHVLKKSVLISSAFLGFLFISLVILWMRVGVFFYGSSSYAFTIVLLNIFLGLGIGLYISPKFFPKTIPFYPIFAVIIVFFGVIGILSFLAIPLLKNINQYIQTALINLDFWASQFTIFWIDAILIYLIPSVLLGIAFVLMHEIIIGHFRNLTRAFDRLEMLLFGGIAVGIFATEFIFISIFGIQKSFVFISLLCFLIGLIIIFIYSVQFEKIKRTSLVFMMVIIFFIFTLLIPSDSVFHIFNAIENQISTFYATEVTDGTYTLYKKNQTNQFVLAKDGEIIAENPLEILTVEEIIGHIPFLLHDNPNSTLLVGMRTENPVKSVSSYSKSQIDIIEDNRKKAEMIALVNNKSHSVEEEHNVHLIFSDKSRFLKFSKSQYDIIIDRGLHPSTKRKGNRYSVDYYKNCQKLLSPAGIFVAWVPIYGLSIEDFKIILKTFQKVFPNATVWYNNNKINYHILLIHRNAEDFNINFKKFTARFNANTLHNELATYGFGNVYDILDCFVMGSDEIDNLTKGLRINTINKPLLEFSTPKTPKSPDQMCQLLQLLKGYREEVYPYLTNVDSTYQRREFVELVTETYFKSSEKVFDGLCAELLQDEEEALRYYQQAISINGLEYGAKRFLDAYFDPLLYRNPNTPSQLMQNAKIYYQKTEYEKAIESLQQAIEMDPNYAPAYFGLGMNYETLGELEKAKEMYQKTLLLKPNLENVKNRLDAVNKKLE